MGYSPWGRKESDTTELSTATAWLEVIEIQSVEVLQGQWPELKKNRKFSEDKNEDIDITMIEWIQQWNSMNMPLIGLLFMKQATLFHEGLKFYGEYRISEDWLQKFQKHCSIKYLYNYDEKTSFHEIDENYIDNLLW